jgi:hypothetical protein
MRASAIKNSSNIMNVKVFSSLAKKENISFTIFVSLDTGSEQERLIPITWDNNNSLLIRDNNKEIQYKGSNCVIDETKDNELAEKLIIDYLKSENVCVCTM